MIDTPTTIDAGPVPEPPMLDCETALSMLWDFLDRRLGEVDDAAVRSHMDRCAHCFPHARFGELVLKAVAAQRDGAARAESVRDRVLDRLRREGFRES